MEEATGRSDAPGNDNELPPRLLRWLDIEEGVRESLETLDSTDPHAQDAVALLTDIHRAVQLWLSCELWQVLQPQRRTPDDLLRALMERDGVEIVRTHGWWPAADHPERRNYRNTETREPGDA